MRAIGNRWTAAALLGLWAAMLCTPASAATFTVNATLDEPDAVIDGICGSTPSGQCTLRAAIQEANALAGADTITLFPGVFDLTRSGFDDAAVFGDLDVTDTVEVVGAGQAQTEITTLQRAFEVFNGTLTLRDLTLRGVDESAGTQGGCIHVATATANAHTDNVTLDGRPGFSGAWCVSVSAGSFVADASTFVISQRMVAMITAYGVAPASITLRDSIVFEEDGNARDFMRTVVGVGTDPDLEVTIQRTSFQGSGAELNDGAILGFACLQGATRRFTIEDSTFDGFKKVGGNLKIVVALTNEPASFACDLFVRRSSFTNNDWAMIVFGQHGGGISEARAHIDDTTFANNVLGVRVGPLGFNQFDPRDRLFLRNVTMSANAEGLVTANQGRAFVSSSTFSGNGTAFANQGVNESFIDNSILANSTVSDCQGNYSGEYNLIESNGCTQLSGNPATIISADPLLGALADNGGPVLTHGLMAGSPAIDAGNPALPASGNYFSCIVQDARGIARPVDGDLNGSFLCDIGALEGPGSAPTFDYGDAPASYGTLLIDDGVRHLLDGALFLGAGVDIESNGLPSLAADGDDLDGSDDEDGVVVPASANAGEMLMLEVTASAPGRLNAWLDVNGDGDFDDSGEQLVSDHAVIAGANSVPLTIPSDAAAADSYLRFRLGSALIDSARSGIIGGEVEDYRITITRNPESNGSQTLIAGTAEMNANLGRATAILDQDMAVGVPGATVDDISNAGEVVMFRRAPVTGWSALQTLSAPDLDPTQDNNRFGISLAFAGGDMGRFLAIGANRGVNTTQPSAGAVYLYRKDPGGLWEFVQKLNAPRTSSNASQRFGEAVAMDFDAASGAYTLAVSAPGHIDAGGPASGGAVFVYQLNPFATFTPIAVTCATPTTPCGGFLFTPDSANGASGDDFGYDLALHGDRLLISAPYIETTTDVFPGQAFLFQRGAMQPDGAFDWTLRASLGDPTPQDAEEFGDSVAVTPTELLISAPYFDHMNGTSGVVYRFSRDATDGAQPIGSLKLPVTRQSAGGSNTFGAGAIAADQNILAVPVSQTCRSVHLYQLLGTPTLLEIIDQPADASSQFGNGLALDADSRTVLVGSPGDTVQGQTGAGTVRVYLGFGDLFADGFEDAPPPRMAKVGACGG